MNTPKPSNAPWYARSPRLALAIAGALSVATLAVVLAYDYASDARPDGPPVAGSVSYLGQVGAALNDEPIASAPPDPPTVAAAGTPGAQDVRREPSAADIQTTVIEQEPQPPTF